MQTSVPLNYTSMIKTIGASLPEMDILLSHQILHQPSNIALDLLFT